VHRISFDGFYKCPSARGSLGIIRGEIARGTEQQIICVTVGRF
jgi:hypothetical protein